MVLVQEHTGQVVYLGPTLEGKIHDKKAVELTHPAFPVNATLGQDSGFQGYAPTGVIVYQPKKTKGKDLTVSEIFINRVVSGVRVKVENVLSGVKRCRMVKDILRLTKTGISDVVMELACGLHNLQVACCHPGYTFDVFSFFTPD